MSYVTGFTKLAMIFGASMLMANAVAQAQDLTIGIDKITCIRETAGEPGSEDEIYFSLAGADYQGTVTIPRFGHLPFDHVEQEVRRDPAHLDAGLADGRQRRDREPGDVDVVEADDRQLIRDHDPGLERRLSRPIAIVSDAAKTAVGRPGRSK